MHGTRFPSSTVEENTTINEIENNKAYLQQVKICNFWHALLSVKPVQNLSILMNVFVQPSLHRVVLGALAHIACVRPAQPLVLVSVRD